MISKNYQKGNLHVYLHIFITSKGDVGAMLMVPSCDLSAMLHAFPSIIAKKFPKVTSVKYTQQATCVILLEFKQMITQSSDG